MSVTTAERTSGPPASIREAKRTPTFDGIRGICATGLLVVHVAWVASLAGSYDQPPKNFAAAFFISGFQIFVGVFFLLSGLFLYRPFARSIIAGTKRPALGPYFLRRALRLLPAYYVMYVAALLLLNLNTINGSVWYVLRPIVLLQNYDFVWMAGLDITWTVPTEVQWYLALPLFAWLTAAYARRGATPAIRARRLMIPVPVLIVIGFAWMAYIHSPSMGQFPKEFWWPIGVAANVAVGMALAIGSALSQVEPKSTPRVFLAAKAHPNLFWLGALVLFLINCAHPFGRAGYGDYDSLAAAQVFYVLFILFGLAAVLPMVAGAKSRLIDATLANRPVAYIGRISYGVYLWHFTVMNMYLKNGNIFGDHVPQTLPELRGTIGFWELEIGVFVGAVIIASISYYLLERPLMEWGERYIGRREKRKAAGSATAIPLQREKATV